MTDNRCISCGRIIPEGRIICLHCEGSDDMQTFTPRTRTNGDRIRAMTNSELASMLTAVSGTCAPGFRDRASVLRWLSEEYKA